MSDWYDADGEPLGHWKPMPREEWTAAYRDLMARPDVDVCVFASVTDLHDDGSARDVRTEWGVRGEDAPRLQCHEGSVYGPYGEHSIFVPALSRLYRLTERRSR